MFNISCFKSLYSTEVDGVSELSWPDLLELFSSHTIVDEKTKIGLFNGTVFQVDEHGVQHRGKTQVEKVSLLVLDYDGTLTIADAKEKFQRYTYLGYSSHSHLRTDDVEKFRLVFPLSSPISAHWKVDEFGMVKSKGDYYHLTEAILDFAPGCDPVVLKPSQLYYFPSCPESTKHLAQIWSNEGEIVDWTKWDKDQVYALNSYSNTLPRKANGLPNRQLDPDASFQVGNAYLKISEVAARMSGVTCPFHVDKSGSEFIVRYPSGVVCFHCKRCGTFSAHQDHLSVTNLHVPPATSIATKASDALVFDERIFDHKDRLKVDKILDAAKKQILNDQGKCPKTGAFNGFASHILYLPEGSGKSQLAKQFVMDGFRRLLPSRSEYFRPQIIFACKSWNQVFEQYASFSDNLKPMNLHCKIALSFQAAVHQKFQVDVTRRTAHGYEVGDIDYAESIRAIKVKHPHLKEDDIEVILNMLSMDAPRFEDLAIPATASRGIEDNHGDHLISIDEDAYTFVEDDEDAPAMILTTFAQLRLIKARYDRIPLNWIIWIDDPDWEEMIDIKPSKRTNFEGVEDIKVLNNTIYDTRPSEQAWGLGFPKHRVIYTTTEKLTLDAIQHNLRTRNIRCEVHGERFKVTGGKLTILGTKAVQKKRDAIFPLFCTRRDLVLIADGIPADYNHTNNKGVNSLNERDLLVEVSVPHPAKPKTYCDAFNLDYKKKANEIGRELMLDHMHQAIGRNSGYRTKGGECVVLVDSNKHKYLLDHCGYTYDVDNSVLIDRTAAMKRSQSRLSRTASTLVSDVEHYINHFLQHAEDQRVIKADIDAVLNAFIDPQKKSRYVIRLLVAITSYAKVWIDIPESDKPSSHERRFRKLMNWIITTHVPSTEKQKLLEDYRTELN